MKNPLHPLAILFIVLHSFGECQNLNNWSLFTNIIVGNASAARDAGRSKDGANDVIILLQPDDEYVLDMDEEILAADEAVLGMTLNTMDHMDNLYDKLMKAMTQLSDQGQLLIGTALPRVALPTKGHNNTKCRLDSLKVKNAATNLSTWALQMLDATANPSDSYMSLSDVYNLGNFDECLAVREADAKMEYFVGQQCLVSIRGAEKATSLDDTKTIVDLLENRTLFWAMCIPSSCTAQDLLHHLQTLIPSFNAVDGGPRMSVLERDCYTATESKPWDVADLIFCGLLGITIVLIILSSFYDYVTSKYKKTIQEMPVLTAFSLTKNLKSLFSRKVTSASLKSIHGIKFASVVWVVVTRRYRTDDQLPTLNHDHMVAELHQDAVSASFMGCNLAVDTLLLVSGALLAHGFFRDRQSKRSFNILVYYVYRYVRLTPVYGIVIGLYATLFYHFGTGPFWNSSVGTAKEVCRENWWLNLLYVNNYGNPYRQCVDDSWFLSVIMQLFWVSPVILYPLWKWPVFGKIVLFMTLLLSIIVPVSLTIPWSPTDIVNTFDLPLYQATFIRSSPYFFGIGLGFILHNLHKDKDTTFALSRWMVLIGWLLSIMVTVSVLYFVNGVQPENDVYMTAIPGVGWSLSTAWFIFACENGYAGGFRKVLSWKLFKPLSRLSFCAFLVHGMVLQYDSGSIKTLQYFSYYVEVHRILGDLLLVFFFSGVFYLAFEKPIINLNRAIFKPELLHRNLQVTESSLQYLSNSNYCFDKSGKNEREDNTYGTAPTVVVATLKNELNNSNAYGTASTTDVPILNNELNSNIYEAAPTDEATIRH